jgi:precorrin-6B C5,15-methyltransferase / cobalt-precorrin-6B C5,C15-methyltransferase
MKRWLTIIGVGDDGLTNLPESSLEILQRASLIVAPDRLLKTGDFPSAQLHFWSAGFDRTLALIQECRDTPVCLIATGDPMHFGIGATLTRYFGAEEMLALPSPSAFSLAAARLGWALQNVDCISLHGRVADNLTRYLSPRRRILALTSGHETVREAAQILTRTGFGHSRLTVLEHMGGQAERRLELSVSEAKDHKGSDFNTLAIECLPDLDCAILPTIAGLPDDAFEHDGQLTKREVRAASLAALAPYPGAVLWDVGAGCGSIAIEWMRAARGASAFAIEDKDSRRAMMSANAKRLGVPELKIIAGRAPEAVAGLAAPDAVFIGGGVSEPNVFEACFEALKPGGRLVANAVTVEGEARLIELAQAWGGALSRIAVSRAEPVGKFLAFKPMMPVTMLVIEKDRI